MKCPWLLISGLITLGAAAPAQAADLVGSSLTGAPTAVGLAQGATLTMTTQRTGATLPLTAPRAGALTSVRIKHGPVGGDTSTYGLRFLTGATPTFTARKPPALSDFSFPAGGAGILEMIPADAAGRPRGFPVLAGERIAVTRLTTTGASNIDFIDGSGGNGAARHAIQAVHDSGTQTYPFQSADRDVLIQYTVEPDADGDGYGDETQDTALGKPGLAEAPVVVETPGPPEIQTIIQTKQVAIACRTGTRPSGSQCVKIKCPKGKRLKGSKCVKKKRSRRRRR